MPALDTLTGRCLAASYDFAGPRLALSVRTETAYARVVATGALATDLWLALAGAKRGGEPVAITCSGAYDAATSTEPSGPGSPT
jgi:hypothetical protein